MNGPAFLLQEARRSTPSKTSLNASNINHEEYRLRTFKSWPVQAPIPADRLAKAGFYYLGNGLEVVCFVCGGRISDWTYGDIAMQKHSRTFPSCAFVNNQSNNVPLAKRLREPESQNPVTNGHSSHHLEPLRIGNSSTHYSVDSPQEAVFNGFPYPRPQEHLSYSELKTNGSKENLSPMRYETERLKTFLGKWPHINIRPVDLAHAGFYYLQISDKVKCVFCNGVLTNWEPGDQPYVEHRNNFPECPFVLGRDVGNVPRGDDICGSNYHQTPERRRIMLNSGPENGNVSALENLEHIGVSLYTGPIHQSQASKDARLRSFVSWPHHAPVKGEDLAEAGFFYIGINDNTKCFSCDGGLTNWEPGDDPWVEHARWFPDCAYVRLNKGVNFIKECVAKGQESTQGKILTPLKRSLSESEQSTSSAYSSYSEPEHVNEETAEAEPTVSVTPLDQKVEESMQSSLVQALLKTKTYPPHLVRLAIMQKLQQTGSSVHNVDELCEAIHNARISNCSTTKNGMQIENGIEESQKRNSEKSGLEELSNNVAQKLRNPGKPDTELTLEEENRLLKEQRLCKICMDQEMGVVFLPCGHLIACVQCAPALTDCALCRSPIKGTVRTFLS